MAMIYNVRVNFISGSWRIMLLFTVGTYKILFFICQFWVDNFTHTLKLAARARE